MINGDEDQASLIDEEPASVNSADDERPPFEDDGEETVGDALRAASDRHEVLLHEIINRLDDIEVATNGNQIRDVTNGFNQLCTTVHENFAMVQDTLGNPPRTKAFSRISRASQSVTMRLRQRRADPNAVLI